MEELFTEPEVNKYESSLGFYVRILGRTGLEYGEGDRTAHVDSEMASGELGVWVFGGSVSQWDAPDGSAITSAERARILDNMKRAFSHFGYSFVVTGI